MSPISSIIPQIIISLPYHKMGRSACSVIGLAGGLHTVRIFLYNQNLKKIVFINAIIELQQVDVSNQYFLQECQCSHLASVFPPYFLLSAKLPIHRLLGNIPLSCNQLVGSGIKTHKKGVQQAAGVIGRIKRGYCFRSPLVMKLFEVVLLHEDIIQLEQKNSSHWYTCNLSPHRVSAMFVHYF